MSYSSAFWSTLKITRFQLCVNEATKKVLKSGNFQSLTRNLSYSSFFSVLCPDLKIHWASSEVLEVTRSFSRSRRPNFLILSVFNEFSFRIFVVLSFEVVWPRWPRRPQKGPREFFFSKIKFSKSVPSNEKDEVCHSFIVKIFTKSLHRGGVGCGLYCFPLGALGSMLHNMWTRTSSPSKIHKGPSIYYVSTFLGPFLTHPPNKSAWIGAFNNYKDQILPTSGGQKWKFYIIYTLDTPVDFLLTPLPLLFHVVIGCPHTVFCKSAKTAIFWAHQPSLIADEIYIDGS